MSDNPFEVDTNDPFTTNTTETPAVEENTETPEPKKNKPTNRRRTNRRRTTGRHGNRRKDTFTDGVPWDRMDHVLDFIGSHRALTDDEQRQLVAVYGLDVDDHTNPVDVVRAALDDRSSLVACSDFARDFLTRVWDAGEGGVDYTFITEFSGQFTKLGAAQPGRRRQAATYVAALLDAEPPEQGADTLTQFTQMLEQASTAQVDRDRVRRQAADLADMAGLLTAA